MIVATLVRETLVWLFGVAIFVVCYFAMPSPMCGLVLPLFFLKVSRVRAIDVHEIYLLVRVLTRGLGEKGQIEGTDLKRVHSAFMIDDAILSDSEAEAGAVKVGVLTLAGIVEWLLLLGLFIHFCIGLALG